MCIRGEGKCVVFWGKNVFVETFIYYVFLFLFFILFASRKEETQVNTSEHISCLVFLGPEMGIFCWCVFMYFGKLPFTLQFLVH